MLFKTALDVNIRYSYWQQSLVLCFWTELQDRQTDRRRTQTASLDSSCLWPFVPAAAARPDSTLCYDLEEVMCEREWNVLSSSPVQRPLAWHGSLKKAPHHSNSLEPRLQKAAGFCRWEKYHKHLILLYKMPWCFQIFLSVLKWDDHFSAL